MRNANPNIDLTLAGMISAMTVQVSAPKPSMKKRIMVSSRRRGSQAGSDQPPVSLSW